MNKCICQNGKFDEKKCERKTKEGPKCKKNWKMSKNVRVKHGLMKDVD